MDVEMKHLCGLCCFALCAWTSSVWAFEEALADDWRSWCAKTLSVFESLEGERPVAFLPMVENTDALGQEFEFMGVRFMLPEDAVSKVVIQESGAMNKMTLFDQSSVLLHVERAPVDEFQPVWELVYAGMPELLLGYFQRTYGESDQLAAHIFRARVTPFELTMEALRRDQNRMSCSQNIDESLLRQILLDFHDPRLGAGRRAEEFFILGPPLVGFISKMHYPEVERVVWKYYESSGDSYYSVEIWNHYDFILGSLGFTGPNWN